MRLLLDTCTFLWIALGSPELSTTAESLYRDPDNEIFLSAASAWEIAVKYSAGKLPIPEPPQIFVPNRRAVYGLRALPLEEQEALHVSTLPNHHRDPFDRMLISQAIAHSLSLLSPDRVFAKYPVRLIW